MSFYMSGFLFSYPIQVRAMFLKKLEGGAKEAKWICSNYEPGF